MIKNLYDKHPVLWGIVLGQGLMYSFILLEYLIFVIGGISEHNIVIDSCLRIVLGVIALVVAKKIYGDRLKSFFTQKIEKATWLYCLPLFLYLSVELLYIPSAKSITLAFVPLFLLECIQQIATGFFEEITSKGLVMSGMLKSWKSTVSGRIAMVFVAGMLFGSMHILNFIFTNDIVSSLWNALYSSAFGVLISAIYLQSSNLTLCMVLHTVWDIIIRIRPNFCENVQYGLLTDVIYVVQNILELGVFPAIAIIICVKCCSNSKA